MLLGIDAGNVQSGALESDATHEKEPNCFYRVESWELAEKLLECFRYARFDIPIPGKPGMTIRALEKHLKVMEGTYDPAFDVVDMADLEMVQRVASQDAVESLERISALGDADPGVWADAGLPHDRRTVLLMEYYREAAFLEPQLRKELAKEAGIRPVYLWFTYGDTMPLDSSADMNEKFYFYKVDRVDLAKHLYSMFQKSQGMALAFGYEYFESDLDAGNKILAESSITRYRNHEVTGIDADFYATAAEWEDKLRTELRLPPRATTQEAAPPTKRPPTDSDAIRKTPASSPPNPRPFLLSVELCINLMRKLDSPALGFWRFQPRTDFSPLFGGPAPSAGDGWKEEREEAREVEHEKIRKQLEDARREAADKGRALATNLKDPLPVFRLVQEADKQKDGNALDAALRAEQPAIEAACIAVLQSSANVSGYAAQAAPSSWQNCKSEAQIMNPIQSNIPGRITASAEMLAPAISELLRRIPDTWQAYRPDDLTETQAQALFLLTAAGMVERRERLRLRMLNHPVVMEAAFTATGEHGGVDALQFLAASTWTEWQDAYRQWKSGDTANVPPMHCERLEPSEWRLTDQGVSARQDVGGGQEARVQDFVLKSGIFKGRGPVMGKGALMKMDKAKAEPAAPGTVNIGNWGEGANAMGQVLMTLFEKMDARRAQTTAKADEAPASGATPVDLHKQDLDARACGVLTAHPGWTNAQIAASLGCARTSLNRLDGFMRAREVQKAAKKGNLRRGHWDKERGQAVPHTGDENEDEDGREVSED